MWVVGCGVDTLLGSRITGVCCVLIVFLLVGGWLVGGGCVVRVAGCMVGSRGVGVAVWCGGLVENCTVDASIFCGQVMKGARWMPRH